jgi:hypothetical protein
MSPQIADPSRDNRCPATANMSQTALLLSCDILRRQLMSHGMGEVDVRRFVVGTCYGKLGELEVADIRLADQDMWDINLAEVVKVNGLAVPADRKLTYRVMRHELRLLLSFLIEAPGKPLSMRHADFRASSGHVKRFISESFGLGMLTAAAERYYGWKLNGSDLYNFDVLPIGIAALYPASGIRPDLLFQFTSQEHENRLAGEARGRSSARPMLFPTSKDQRDRLADIVAWSGVNELHPVTMTYAYTGAVNAQVDLFDVAAPEELKTDLEVVGAESEGLVTQTGQRFERLSYIRQRALSRVGEIADQLYATAPQDASGLRRTVYGHNVRGSWATADLIVPTRLRFFFGLLDQPLTPEEVAGRRGRSTPGQQDTDPIQVASTGRILVVVARNAAQDPSWSEVSCSAFPGQGFPVNFTRPSPFQAARP